MKLNISLVMIVKRIFQEEMGIKLIAKRDLKKSRNEVAVVVVVSRVVAKTGKIHFKILRAEVIVVKVGQVRV